MKTLNKIVRNIIWVKIKKHQQSTSGINTTITSVDITKNTRITS